MWVEDSYHLLMSMYMISWLEAALRVFAGQRAQTRLANEWVWSRSWTRRECVKEVWLKFPCYLWAEVEIQPKEDIHSLNKTCSEWPIQELMQKENADQPPSPITFRLTLLVIFPAILATEQEYSPASLCSRLLMTSAELPVLLMILLPSPRRNTLPSFSQRISGSGMPVKVHTSSKLSPTVWLIGTGRLSMVGWAVGEKQTYTLCVL